MVEKTGRELSLIGIGESFEAEEEADLIERLRDLLDSLTLKGWVWPSKGYEIVSFRPPATGKRFTVGPTRNVVTTRVPLLITAVVDARGRPLIQMDLLSVLKEGEKPEVTHFFYELVSDDANALNYGTAQYGRIHFNRALETTETVDIYYQQPLMAGGALSATDELLLPFGYDRLMIFLFAKELLNSYGITDDTATRVMDTSRELMGDVVRINKDLYVGSKDSMLKSSIPGTDATVEGNTPSVGMPLSRG